MTGTYTVQEGDFLSFPEDHYNPNGDIALKVLEENHPPQKHSFSVKNGHAQVDGIPVSDIEAMRRAIAVSNRVAPGLHVGTVLVVPSIDSVLNRKP